ncbi:LRR receptor-like serine threonine kinase [Fusarium subglutinans]|uniref:LRR receptor-like serine threonine kinase n=1 Tax=Gibberella subglutinans TaxID=42677 RepID=A0A8H5PX76_GIBSU|nr:LRR receptor-like serine threonine kinase [Fusarium subglutinans]KAF5603833.1 LRR receptor-like serine threonine kinase [Fusarium subglutinans]
MDDVRSRGISPTHIREPDTVQVEAVEATTNAQICGYFSHNTDYKAGCASPSTCSTPTGGKSWGCCDETSCYIPATCEDASVPDCGGTAASLCPYSPIMKWASSRCLYFIYQTASDDNAKLTSWGCGETPTTYIIGPLQVEQTAAATASTKDESDSSSGPSKEATIILAVILPVVGLAILVATTILLLRRRKKRASNVITAPSQGTRSEMGQTTDCAPAPAPSEDALRPELDSRERKTTSTGAAKPKWVGE